MQVISYDKLAFGIEVNCIDIIREHYLHQLLGFVRTKYIFPYLIIHGAEDETVSPHQSKKLAQKFDVLKVPHKLVLTPKGDHFLRRNRKEVDELREEWFQKYLK